jgi:hypothetical protein
MDPETCRRRAREVLELGRNHTDLAYVCVRLAEGWEQAARDFETGVLNANRAPARMGADAPDQDDDGATRRD